jgi:hypothetical protein
VTRRFLKTKACADTECIVVGGGFRESRVGELAIARTDILLKADDFTSVSMVGGDSYRDRAACFPADRSMFGSI